MRNISMRCQYTVHLKQPSSAENDFTARGVGIWQYLEALWRSPWGGRDSTGARGWRPVIFAKHTSCSTQDAPTLPRKTSASFKCYYQQTPFYCTLLYCAPQMLCFLHIERLWQPCIEQVHLHHFSPAAFVHFLSLYHILV